MKNTSIASLSRRVKVIAEAMAGSAPVGCCIRNDRDAARFCGFKSPWRFSLWAMKRGLKPKPDGKKQERTVYLVDDLKAACEADQAGQFAINS